MRPATRRTHAPALALAAVTLAVGLAGCSSTNDGGGDSSADSGSAVASSSQRNGLTTAAEGRAAAVPAPADGAFAAQDLSSAYGGNAEPAPDLLAAQRAVIRKGNVALRADDVGTAQSEVKSVVDKYFGRVTAEETTTDDKGHPAHTRMELRIPSKKFDEAMTELKGIAELDSANTQEADVTTKLIDARTRIEAQRRSIARITVLFDRAQSIRDIMAIEAQLSRRQADLESLERQAAYLSGQAALSTIVVNIDQIPETTTTTKPKDDDTGFVAGFKAGWDALSTFAIGLSTALGAALPWLVLLAILGYPVWLLVRALRRRFTPSKPEQTPSAA